MSGLFLYMPKYRFYIAEENKYIYFCMSNIHNEEEDTLFWRYKLSNESNIDIFVWIDSMGNRIYTWDIVMRKWIDVWYWFNQEVEHIFIVKYDWQKSWFLPFCEPHNEWWKLFWYTPENWTVISNIMDCKNHNFNPYR